MRPIGHLLRGIAVSATLALALPGVAHAGMNDRAQQAIAEAKGKISAGTMVGAGEEALGLQMRAKTALNNAEALLSKGKKAEAVAAAQQAGMLADQALAATQTNKDAKATAAVGEAQASAASAQQSAVIANEQAAAANARADMAMAAPAPVAVIAPAPSTTTTVTTEERTTPAPVVQKKATRTTTRTTARKPSRPVVVQKTTVETRQD